MKTLFLSIILLPVFTAGFGQTNCAVKKGYAFYNISIPGAQMADENGNPIPPKADITRVVYIEYSGTKAPEIKAVLYGKQAFNYTVTRLTQRSLTVGDKKLNAGNTLTAKKGNSLLQVSLQPVDGREMPEAGCRNIIIKTKSAGKTCTLTISSEKEFFSPPRY